MIPLSGEATGVKQVFTMSRKEKAVKSRSVLFVGATLLVATVLCANRVLSQQEDKKGGPEDAMMEAVMKAAQPGEHHAHLNPLVGNWNLHSKWRFAPEAPWEESTGTAEFKWVMGGRYILEKIESTMGDETFEGIGILGYDNIKKKHFSAWIDNMGTMIMTSEGSCDASGKVVTLYGQHPDPVDGTTKKQKSVHRIINNDKHVFEIYDRTADGKEFKSLEVTYTRK